MKIYNIILLLFSSIFFQQDTNESKYFNKSWDGNGFSHMNIYIINHNLNIGDEVAVFCNTKCVGTSVVYSEIITIVCSMDDNTGNGFINGDTIIYKTNISDIIDIKYHNNYNFWVTDGHFKAYGSAFIDLYYNIIVPNKNNNIIYDTKLKYYNLLGQEIDVKHLSNYTIYIEIKNGTSRKILNIK